MALSASGGMPMPVSLTAKAFHGVIFTPAGSEAQGDAAPLGEFHRVAEQIDQHLAQLADVAAHRGRTARIRPGLPMRKLSLLFLAWMLKERRQFTNQGDEIEIGGLQFHAPGVDLGKIEDFVDEMEEVVATAGDRGQGVTLEGVQRAVAQQDLRIAENGVHRGADFVAHVGEKFGLGPAGCFRGSFGALADVDFGEQRGVGLGDFRRPPRIAPKKRRDQRGDDEPRRPARRAIATKAGLRERWRSG